MFVQVHVQVHAFPRVCLKTMLGERAGTIVGQPWGNCGAIFGAFWSMLRPLGTILGPRGTSFEAPFPRFGQNIDFRRFSGERVISLGTLFHPWATLVPCLGRRMVKIGAFFGNLV